METNNSVWTIEYYDDVDPITIGIYSTKQLATQVHDKIQRGKVVERRLNPGAIGAEQHYKVVMARDGTAVVRIVDKSSTSLNEYHIFICAVSYIPPGHTSPRPACLLSYVWAVDEEAVIAKVDSERLRRINSGEWCE